MAREIDEAFIEAAVRGYQRPDRLLRPVGRSCGGDGRGRRGGLGGDRPGWWSAALAAGGREAAGHGARLTDLASALRQAAAGYREAEDAAHRRHGAVG